MTRRVIGIAALLIVVGLVYWFTIRDPYCDNGDGGICKVTVSVTSWPCTKDTLSVVPDELPVHGLKNIRWTIVNADPKQVLKFAAEPKGIVFTGEPKPAPGEFKTVRYSEQVIQMQDKPRTGFNRYKYVVNLETSTGACSKDPWIGNNG